jgi:hypothetical protein
MMTTLQEEVRLTLKHMSPSLKSRKNRFRLNLTPPAAPWAMMAIGVLILGASFFIGSVVYLTHHLTDALQQEKNRAHWLVLVKGSPLEIDDVGRLLTQFPGALNVTYLPPVDVLKIVQADHLFSEDLSDINIKDLPGSWEVQWSNEVASPPVNEIVADIKKSPGVIEVAFDGKAIEQARFLRKLRTTLRLMLAVTVFVAVLFSLIVLGRFIFLSTPTKFQGGEFWLTVAQAFLFWMAGTLLARQLVGPVSWKFLTVGLLVGAIHYFWILSRKNS